MLGTKDVRRASCAGAGLCRACTATCSSSGSGRVSTCRTTRPRCTGVWTVDPSAVALKLAQKRIAASNVAGARGRARRRPARLPRRPLRRRVVDDDAVHDPRRRRRARRGAPRPEAGRDVALRRARARARREGRARSNTASIPWQQRFAGGCHLARDMRALLTGGRLRDRRARRRASSRARRRGATCTSAARGSLPRPDSCRA